MLLVGDRHFPESRRDNQLSHENAKSGRYGDQCGDAPVAADRKVGARQDKTEDRDKRGIEITSRCRLQAGEEFVVITVESCAAHIHVTDPGH